MYKWVFSERLHWYCRHISCMPWLQLTWIRWLLKIKLFSLDFAVIARVRATSWFPTSVRQTRAETGSRVYKAAAVSRYDAVLFMTVQWLPPVSHADLISRSFTTRAPYKLARPDRARYTHARLRRSSMMYWQLAILL